MGRHALTWCGALGAPAAPPSLAGVEILLWLAFPAVATLAAMVWAAWAGRPEREPSEADADEAYRRFAAAVAKPHPRAGRRVEPPAVSRSTGVALRRTRSAPASRAEPASGHDSAR